MKISQTWLELFLLKSLRFLISINPIAIPTCSGTVLPKMKKISPESRKCFRFGNWGENVDLLWPWWKFHIAFLSLWKKKRILRKDETWLKELQLNYWTLSENLKTKQFFIVMKGFFWWVSVKHMANLLSSDTLNQHTSDKDVSRSLTTKNDFYSRIIFPRAGTSPVAILNFF